MRNLDVKLRLTFVRRDAPGSDRPVILIMPAVSGPNGGHLTPVKIAHDRELPDDRQWTLITASLDAGVSVSLGVCDFDHALDVFRAVAIETGRVTDPDLVRAGGVV